MGFGNQHHTRTPFTTSKSVIFVIPLQAYIRHTYRRDSMPQDSDGDSAGGVLLLPSPTTATTNPTPRKPKKPFTHFLSLPLHHAPDLQTSIDILTNDISTYFPSLNIPSGAIRPARAAHLTLGVMSLTSAEMVERAVELLKSTDMDALLQEVTTIDNMAELLDPKAPMSFRVSLQGLATMGPPNKTSVLYTVPYDPTNRLLPFTNALRKCFIAEGLIQDESRELRLHVTVLNTVYAKKGGRKNKGRQITLDVRDLVQEFGERVFVKEVEVNRVAICLMGAKDKDGIKGAAGYEEIFGKTL